MTPEIIIVFVVLIVSVILFATEVLPVDLTALIIMGFFIVIGILTPEEGLRGFSNTATVTVAAMFVLSEALIRTGFVEYLGRNVTRIFRLNFWVAMGITMLIISVFSAFLNNTPLVAIFIPIMITVAKETGISVSKLLMPLSFASIFGGQWTLIGTSTNILVNSIAIEYGQPAFGMFEFAPLGLILMVVGIIYMLLIGIRITPNRRNDKDLTSSYGMGDYLTEIIIEENSPCANISVEECPLVKDLDIDIIKIVRNEKDLVFTPFTLLKANDVLRVRTNVEKIKALQAQEGIILKSQAKWNDIDLESEDSFLMEAVIAPNSILIGRTLKDIKFRNRFKATALAIRHIGRVLHENIGNTVLRAGDAILIITSKYQAGRLRDNRNFVVVSKVGLPTYRKRKMVYAMLILAGVIGFASLEILPIAVTALIGSILVVLTGCINLNEAYRSLDLKIIALLAGSLSLGLAMEKTGAAKLLSENIVSYMGVYGPFAILAAFYLLTLVLTEIMSNNATAALITPIAITTATSLGLSPRPFLIAVMFAATLAFMSPVGYQTHLLIYSPGKYRFMDFIKVGTPLDIIFWLLTALLIPIFFPF